MKKILIFLAIIVIFAIALLSYIGIFPFFSSYLNKPKDLGIKADPQLVYDFEKKYGQNSQNGKVELNVSLSSQEITSVFAVWEIRDKNFPLKDVQVKFNPDGTGEASGILKLPVAINLAKNLGYSDSDIEKGKNYVQFVAGDLPFYVKGSAAMENNSLSMNPSNLTIGRINVPSTIVDPLKSLVTDLITRRISQIGGADIKSANFKDGKFNLNGTVPSTINY